MGNGTDFIDVMRLLVSLVNWQVTPLLLHSVHDELSVASHCGMISNSGLERRAETPTLTFRSRQASQLGSFLRWR